MRIDILSAVLVNSQVLWDAMLCWLGNSHQCFGGAYCLHLQGLAVQEVCLCALLDLRMETRSSCEMLVPFYKLAQPHIPNDCYRSSHSHNLQRQYLFFLINHNARFVFKFNISCVIQYIFNAWDFPYVLFLIPCECHTSWLSYTAYSTISHSLTLILF
jgi:hypothetical protein